MTDNDATKRPRGRPPRREKALRSVDPASVDPLRILAAVASDPGQPGTARVRAALALLQNRLDRSLRRANGLRLACDDDGGDAATDEDGTNTE